MSEFKDWVDANYLGTNVENNIQTEKRFLYERPPVRYDSVTPELELLKRNYDKNVTVFGNLPKKLYKFLNILVAQLHLILSI